MSIFTQDAFIYKGKCDLSGLKGALVTAFSDVENSSQGYRVVIKGVTSKAGNLEDDTAKHVCDHIASWIVAENLQDLSDIHAVARGCHDFLKDEYNAEKQRSSGLKPFDEMPFVLILRKPGKLQNVEEILDAATPEVRSRVEREMNAPVRAPENV